MRGRVGEGGWWVMASEERTSCLGSGGKRVGHHTRGRSTHAGEGSRCGGTAPG